MSLISELKRRRVFRVAALYGVTAWVITEVSATVLPLLGLPERLVTIIVVLLIVGFPVTLILAWIFDLGPDGIERTLPGESVTPEIQITNRLMLFVATAIATTLLGTFFIWRLNTDDPPVRDSIAVLPFTNMAGQADSDFFSDGISEELLNLLANVPGLKVAARTSSFAFKNQDIDIRSIARELGVATVLEGSVRWSEDASQVRITAQLIDADTGYHLWSQTYDRKLEDIFAVQDEIANAIVSNLQLQFATVSDPQTLSMSTPPTQNVEAYTLYLKGRALWNQRGEDALRKSVELFEAALVLDPLFARAHSNLAAAYVLLPAYADLSQEEYFAKASESALAALALDERLAEAHAVLAHISNQRWQWNDAETSFYFATSLDPDDPTAHHWYSIHLGMVGRFQEALKEAETAARLDPNSAVIQANLAMMLQMMGRSEQATAAAKRAGDLGLTDGADGLLAEFAIRQGELESALSLLRRSAEADTERMATVQEIITALENPDPSREFADSGQAFTSAVFRGELDLAYDLAERMSEDRSLPVQNLWYPSMGSFREDSRFASLMQKTGLTDYWRRYGWAEFCGENPATDCG